MADLKALNQFIGGLKGDFMPSGIIGATTQHQHVTDELKRAFAGFRQEPDDKQAEKNFRAALLVAHAVSVINDDELDRCESWLKDK
jgi:hypothetical protein